MKKYRIRQIKKIGDKYYSYRGIPGKGGRHVYDKEITEFENARKLAKKLEFSNNKSNDSERKDS